MSNRSTFGDNQFIIIPPFDQSGPEAQAAERRRFVLVKPLVIPQSELNSNAISEPSASGQPLNDQDNVIWFE